MHADFVYRAKLSFSHDITYTDEKVLALFLLHSYSHTHAFSLFLLVQPVRTFSLFFLFISSSLCSLRKLTYRVYGEHVAATHSCCCLFGVVVVVFVCLCVLVRVLWRRDCMRFLSEREREKEGKRKRWRIERNSFSYRLCSVRLEPNVGGSCTVWSNVK